MAKIDLEHLPTGIRIRTFKSGSQSIRIHFNYRGVECRETLANFEPTKANIRYAANLRGEILMAIMQGTFHYGDYFPNSERATLFGMKSKQVLIKTLLKNVQEDAEKTAEVSTYTPYRRMIKKHLMPAFGEICIGDLKPYHIREFIKNLKKPVKDKKTGVISYKPLKCKSVKNILIQLRKVVNRALIDELIHKNPFDNIVLSEILPKESFKSEYVIDPFEMWEIQTIINSLPPSEKAMAQFWFFTGLRPSELMALEWQDVNFDKGTVFIDRAIVYWRLKDPKTKSGKRLIMLLPPALEALTLQKTYALNRKKRVFFNPKNKRVWSHDQQLRAWWIGVCEQAGVRYRNPYQCRHTFATLLVSKGENILWIADQMGHVDTEMVIRTYAKKPKFTTGYQFKNNWDMIFKETRFPSNLDALRHVNELPLHAAS